MSSPQSLHVITANDLLTGAVVYLDAARAWTTALSAAMLFEDIVAAQTCVAALARQDTMVIGVDLAAVVLDQNGAPMPVHFREGFRATGPSNRPSPLSAPC